MKNKKPRILFIDIETTPLISYTWGIWEQDVIEVKEEWYILSCSYKWLGENKTYFLSLPDYKLFKKDMKDDKSLIINIWKLFDEADIIIAHNGDEFDIKKIQSRFVQHGLIPPSPFKTIDTKKVAKKYFKFDSNKLDHLGQYLNLGRKIKHEGFSLWLGCMAGDKKSWKKMREYNIQDIVLLEKVYLRLKPYMTNHPDTSMYTLGDEMGCKNCGGSNNQRRGFAIKRGITGIIRHQRYQCQDCGAWWTGEKV